MLKLFQLWPLRALSALCHIPITVGLFVEAPSYFLALQDAPTEFFFFWSSSMWDLSSPTRDWTHAPPHWKHRVLTIGLPGKSPAWSYTFLAPVVESAISPRNPGSLHWRTVLETKIWASGVLLIGLSLFLRGP